MHIYITMVHVQLLNKTLAGGGGGYHINNKTGKVTMGWEGGAQSHLTRLTLLH